MTSINKCSNFEYADCTNNTYIDNHFYIKQFGIKRIHAIYIYLFFSVQIYNLIRSNIRYN